MALERSTARAVEPWPWPEEEEDSKSKLQGGARALAASLALVILQQLPRVAPHAPTVPTDAGLEASRGRRARRQPEPVGRAGARDGQRDRL